MQRLFILIFIIILVGVIDNALQIKRVLDAHHQQHMQTKTLLPKKSPRLSHHIKFWQQTMLLDRLLKESRASGLTLIKMDSTKKNNEVLLSDTIFSGQFFQIENFFQRLREICFPFMANQFELTNQQGKLFFSIKLSLLNACDNQSTSSMRYLKKNPHIVGYLQLPHETLSIVKLPTGAVFAIHLNKQGTP